MTEVAVENKKWVRNTAYWAKLNAALDEYKNILIIGVDFVGSSQMQKTRISLRGKGIVLMGKNTIIRKVLRERAEKNPALEALIPYVYGNIGFVFTNGDLNALRQLITANKVPASAKNGCGCPHRRGHSPRTHRSGPWPNVFLPDAQYWNQNRERFH